MYNGTTVPERRLDRSHDQAGLEFWGMGGCTKKPRRARLESLPCILIVSDHAKPGVVTRSESGLGDLGTESVWLEEPC
jgi:hypothetical protein